MTGCHRCLSDESKSTTSSGSFRVCTGCRGKGLKCTKMDANVSIEKILSASNAITRRRLIKLVILVAWVEPSAYGLPTVQKPAMKVE